MSKVEAEGTNGDKPVESTEKIAEKIEKLNGGYL